MAKKIEYPTGNQAIDWLLENERHGLNEDSVSPAIRFLIGKFNELVSDGVDPPESESALPISDVVKSDCIHDYVNGQHIRDTCKHCGKLIWE